MITDQPERLIISDIVREKILLSTRDEIPHAIAVDVDEMKTRDDGTTYIRATIYCERDSQKGIIIGNKGALLRKIGAEARMDIQKLLATKVYLDLWVKVKKIGVINRVCFQNWDIKNRLFRLIIVRKDCYGQYRCPVTDWVRHSMYFLN